MRILLTNDDGYAAPGIKALYTALSRAHDVVVSAPRREQSGVSHAFTFHSPLRYSRMPAESGMPGWAVEGTPSDCVKFAVSTLMDRMPDIVVAGINRGENSGISGFYSGTVAAAREGAFWKIPSFAFSISNGGFEYLDEYSAQVLPIIERVLAIAANGWRNDRNAVFFNVNFPGCRPCQSRGIRVTRQSMAFFEDKYREEAGPDGQPGYWVYGDKVELEDSDQYDSRGLLSNYTCITPLWFDATAHEAITALGELEQVVPGEGSQECRRDPPGSEIRYLP